MDKLPKLPKRKFYKTLKESFESQHGKWILYVISLTLIRTAGVICDPWLCILVTNLNNLCAEVESFHECHKVTV